MSPWLTSSLRRATPFAVYLVLFAFLCLLWGGLKGRVDDDSKSVLSLLVLGTAVGGFIAFWKLAMAFGHDGKPLPIRTGYIDIPDQQEMRAFSELLLGHARQLRRITLSYERHRQNLTRIGVTIAIASLAVPVATWTVILQDAFSTKETMPNAWLLVVSSTATGALGLAISITLLRHLKNNQKPLAEMSQRLMLCMETNISLCSEDATKEQRAAALSKAIDAFVMPPSIASARPETPDQEAEGDKKLATTLLSMFKPSSET
ncbi:MAG: hypothetical protein REI94_10115 [Moraxellaceae bacterium]|nr:hypothetical protein [Moraxellaceae bacterium]